MYKIEPFSRKYFNDIILLRNQYIDYLRQPFFLNEINQENWFVNTKDQYFTILRDNKFVGCIGICGLDLINRKAELSLITENYLDVRIADFALDFIENYFFTKLSGHKLFITAFEFDGKKRDYFSNRYGNYKFAMEDNVFFQGKFWHEFYYCKIKLREEIW